MEMYVLSKRECSLVGGGSGTGETVPGLDDDWDCKTKNNNGYGNGAEAGPAPGNSGSHNPQLLTQNSGPRGDR
jgi:hypothetical protein